MTGRLRAITIMLYGVGEARSHHRVDLLERDPRLWSSPAAALMLGGPEWSANAGTARAPSAAVARSAGKHRVTG